MRICRERYDALLPAFLPPDGLDWRQHDSRTSTVTPEERLMKDVVEAWGEADVGPVMAVLDNDVVWKSASLASEGRFRFGGVYRGRENVVALISKVSTAYFFSSCETKEVLSKGDVVWGHFVLKGTYAPIGSRKARAPIVLEQVFRWRLREGKIVESQSFFDTANLLVQQGDPPDATARAA